MWESNDPYFLSFNCFKWFLVAFQLFFFVFFCLFFCLFCFVVVVVVVYFCCLLGCLLFPFVLFWGRFQEWLRTHYEPQVILLPPPPTGSGMTEVRCHIWIWPLTLPCGLRMAATSFHQRGKSLTKAQFQTARLKAFCHTKQHRGTQRDTPFKWAGFY